MNSPSPTNSAVLASTMVNNSNDVTVNMSPKREMINLSDGCGDDSGNGGGGGNGSFMMDDSSEDGGGGGSDGGGGGVGDELANQRHFKLTRSKSSFCEDIFDESLHELSRLNQRHVLRQQWYRKNNLVSRLRRSTLSSSNCGSNSTSCISATTLSSSSSSCSSTSSTSTSSGFYSSCSANTSSFASSFSSSFATLSSLCESCDGGDSGGGVSGGGTTVATNSGTIVSYNGNTNSTGDSGVDHPRILRRSSFKNKFTSTYKPYYKPTRRFSLQLLKGGQVLELPESFKFGDATTKKLLFDLNRSPNDHRFLQQHHPHQLHHHPHTISHGINLCWNTNPNGDKECDTNLYSAVAVAVAASKSHPNSPSKSLAEYDNDARLLGIDNSMQTASAAAAGTATTQIVITNSGVGGVSGGGGGVNGPSQLHIATTGNGQQFLMRSKSLDDLNTLFGCTGSINGYCGGIGSNGGIGCISGGGGGGVGGGGLLSFAPPDIAASQHQLIQWTGCDGGGISDGGNVQQHYASFNRIFIGDGSGGSGGRDSGGGGGAQANSSTSNSPQLFYPPQQTSSQQPLPLSQQQLPTASLSSDFASLNISGDGSTCSSTAATLKQDTNSFSSNQELSNTGIHHQQQQYQLQQQQPQQQQSNNNSSLCDIDNVMKKIGSLRV